VRALVWLSSLCAFGVVCGLGVLLWYFVGGLVR